ncbi:LPS-assembly protein LptD [Spirochaeta isovalerica]|uniref:Lipopolysaccharide assembly outer membrane protein LptD (OstA) n=1 Tax=Spirochaeta isovalerica TaxID=150 RepID=A0A841R3U0_9SPIO|nr:LPS-assembly protein LptD [Spirochaeta isovalerica]MBB6478535.1 lipopolysaccharide assembly outer membrane protein LptD (OstA) [Spirochaeta isovalerica]
MKTLELTPRKLLLILLVFSFHPVFSQDAETEVNTLFTDTIYSDINTASYYELLSWCRDLDLDTKGNSDFLKKQLYSHYDVDLNSVESGEGESDIIVKIVSADRSEYYSLEEISEDYVRISGRVKLIVKQVSLNTTHTIEADSVLFNQTTDTMTASGNIIYIKEENGNKEEYSGDNFTFNVQNWKGVILKGDFKRTQEVNKQDMEFIFSGDAIKKGEGDVVVLDQGSITSCEEEEPHYRIEAKKIWILGPDEWAILNGALYIGHIPVLYIPFYHLPGNDLFFNPVIGDESRRGYYIQTTTYLLGKKQNSEEDDSFFINIADSDETYKLVPQGLYLFKEKGEPEKDAGSDFIKYKLDYYSRLGGYTALEGSLSELWKLKGISFDLGIGVTRSIKGSGGVYTNYFDENDFIASWNGSDFFGASVPFRWGLSFGFSLLTFKLNFEYLTDPYFRSDFSGREENFDWLNYLLSQTTEDEGVEENAQSSLNWSLQGNINIPNKWADDYIKNFSLSSLKVNMLWNSKDNNDYQAPADPQELYDPYSPSRLFFYPSNITWPQTSLNLSGVLLEYKTGPGDPVPEDELEDRDIIKAPWNDGNDKENGEKKGDEDYIKKPERFDGIAIEDADQTFFTKIDYSLTGYLNFTSYMNSEIWGSPADIDFDILKSLLTNKNTFNLNYNFKFFEDILSLSGKNTLTADYLSYYGDFTEDEERNELNGRKLNWLNTLDFTIKPLRNVAFFNKSTISYEFDTNLYSLSYDAVQEVFLKEWIEWDDDDITAHRAAVNIDFSMPLLTLALSFDSTLPPRDIKQSISPSLAFSIWKWTGKVAGKVTYDENQWTPEPLTVSTRLAPLDEVSLSGDFSYNFENETPASLSAAIKLWALTGSYNMAYATDYEWDKDLQQLKDMGKDFVPTSFSLGINYQYESPMLWKNRIAMDGKIDLNLNMNLQQYNLSKLGFKLSYNLHIFEFLDLTFSIDSSNEQIFLYFPSLRDYYGITEDYSFFKDLFKSFNIFSSGQQDRYESFFNMNSLNVSLVHKLHDWDLEMTYSGKPVLDEGVLESRWDSTFSILVRWNPIEKLKVQSKYANELWNVDTEFE